MKTEALCVETIETHDIRKNRKYSLKDQMTSAEIGTETANMNIVDRREDSSFSFSPSSSPSITIMQQVQDERERREEVTPAPTRVRFNTDVNHNKASTSRGRKISTGSDELLSSLKNKSATKPYTYSRPTVFERLSNADTVASIHRKLVSRQIRKRSTSAPPSLLRSGSGSGSGSVSNLKKEEQGRAMPPSRPQPRTRPRSAVPRHASHTKLSKIRQRRLPPTSTPTPPEKPLRKSTFRRRGRGMRMDTEMDVVDVDVDVDMDVVDMRLTMEATKEHIFESTNEYQYDENRDRQNSIEQKQFDDELSSVAAMSVPNEIEFTSRMQIYTTNTHKPEDGYQELDPLEYGYDLNGSLEEYEAGGMSVKELSSEIVSMLLLSDLPQGVDWDWRLRTPLYRDLALPLGEVGFSFFLETETEEHGNENVNKNGSGIGNTLPSASATGNIIFIHDLSEIHIENYSFVLDEVSM